MIMLGKPQHLERKLFYVDIDLEERIPANVN